MMLWLKVGKKVDGACGANAIADGAVEIGVEAGLTHFNNMTMLSFHSSILLWPTRTRNLLSYTMLLKKGTKSMTSELTATIDLYDNSVTKPILNHHFKCHKGRHDIRFLGKRK